MTDLIKLEDGGIVAQALKPSGMRCSLSQLVPDDLEPHRAMANIKELVGGLNHLGNASSVIGAILGAHLALCRRRPELWEHAYDSLAELEKVEVSDKLSHGALWNWKRCSEAFPEASIGSLLKAGSTNLLKAAKVLPPDASPSQREHFLEKAAELNTAQFTSWVEQESGLSEPGGTTTANFTAIGTKAEISQLRELLADEDLRQMAISLCGNDRALSVILASLENSRLNFGPVQELPLDELREMESKQASEEPTEIQSGAVNGVVEDGGWA